MKTLQQILLVILPLVLLSASAVCQSANTVAKDSKIIISVQKKLPSSENSKDGSITISIKGINGSFEVRFMGPETSIKVQNKTDLLFSNLIKGEYLIIVRDSEGNVRHSSVELK